MRLKKSKVVVVGLAAAAVGGLMVAGTAGASSAGAVRVQVCAKASGIFTVQGWNQDGNFSSVPWQGIGGGACKVVGFQGTDWWWQIGSQVTVGEQVGSTIHQHTYGIPPHKYHFLFDATGYRDGDTITVGI
ncbi:MAG: hypothetical protein JO362_00715 [Streptomycetaceae bacterium]|nr:hypothetical protein [Streptomycetaceae bacterium]